MVTMPMVELKKSNREISNRIIAPLFTSVLIISIISSISSAFFPISAFAAAYGTGLYGSGSYAGTAPTVTTGSASSITSTTAVLNGAITDTGTTSPSVRGFVYGTTVSYGATTTDSAGPFSTGAFTASLSNLTCDTAYNFAAYATSTNGIGYGSNATFTTSVCSSGNAVTPGARTGGGSSVPVIAVALVVAKKITTTTTPTTFVFNRDLKLGSVGADVKNLQIFLNTNGFKIANTGPGSLKNETTVFGQMTKQALIKYQKSKRISATGYFGPLTRKAVK